MQSEPKPAIYACAQHQINRHILTHTCREEVTKYISACYEVLADIIIPFFTHTHLPPVPQLFLFSSTDLYYCTCCSGIAVGTDRKIPLYTNNIPSVWCRFFNYILRLVKPHAFNNNNNDTNRVYLREFVQGEFLNVERTPVFPTSIHIFWKKYNYTTGKRDKSVIIPQNHVQQMEIYTIPLGKQMTSIKQKA